MSEITPDQVRKILAEQNPVQDAFVLSLKTIMFEAVEAVGYMLRRAGIDPKEFPAQSFIQCALLEAEVQFAPMTKEQWDESYRVIREAQKVMSTMPEYKDNPYTGKSETDPEFEAGRKDIKDFLDSLYGDK